VHEPITALDVLQLFFSPLFLSLFSKWSFSSPVGLNEYLRFDSLLVADPSHSDVRCT
jgi:hypothetical protein